MGDTSKEVKGGQNFPFCFKECLYRKCSKTHLQASLIPKFSRGNTPDSRQKGGRTEGEWKGRGKKGKTDAPGLNNKYTGWPKK